jgi:ribosome biogenesis GTPase
MKGKICVFSGHSGVGKSSIINALDNSIHIKTQDISEQHNQGMHTTTFAEMHDTAFDAKIIDTPGIRGFGMIEMTKEELGDYFVELFELKHECKFNNCLHLNEPKCAIKEAVERGEIEYSRYKSYLQILDEIEDNQSPYRQDNYS